MFASKKELARVTDKVDGLLHAECLYDVKENRYSSGKCGQPLSERLGTLENKVQAFEGLGRYIKVLENKVERLEKLLKLTHRERRVRTAIIWDGFTASPSVVPQLQLARTTIDLGGGKIRSLLHHEASLATTEVVDNQPEVKAKKKGKRK